MGNTQSVENQISPHTSRQNTQINVLPADEGLEMRNFQDPRAPSPSASQTFAERAWNEGSDGPSVSTKMSNGTAAKKGIEKKINTKKVKEKLDKVLDYMKAKRSNTDLSVPASARDVVAELGDDSDNEAADEEEARARGLSLKSITDQLKKQQPVEKYNVIGNFFERMGSNVGTDRSPEESERGPSPADSGGPVMKKRPLGDDPRPATVLEKKKPPGYRDEVRNKLATSELNREVPVLQFATLKYHRKCIFSHSHCVYTRDESILQDMPPPHPPYTRKSEIFESSQYRRVDKKAVKVPKTVLNGLLCELVGHLTDAYKDDTSKLRALYVWLTSQNLRKLKLPLKPARDGYVLHYLEKLKKRKGNYAHFFSHLCNLAGLPCVVIHGYLKGSTYEIGQTLTKDTHYGEWNAVLIDNNWRLVNTYWGSCAVGGDFTNDVTTYRFDENFFMPDPDQLAYTHFPEETKWQLMEPAMSMFNFERRAFLKERFFELDMRVLSHPDCEFKVQNGEEEILFGMNEERAPHLKFMCLIYMKEEKDYRILYDDENRYQHDFLYKPNEDSLSIKIRFPKRGTYRVEIVGKDTTIKDDNYEYDWIAIYKATVLSGPKKYAAFPKAADAGWGSSQLLQKLGLTSANFEQDRAVVTAEEGMCTIGYDINTPEAEELSLSYKMINVNSGLEDVAMETNAFTKEDGKFQVYINIPPGDEGAFCLFAQVDDPEYGSIEKNLCNYLIISTPLKELDKQEKKEVKVVGDVLEDAIHFKQLEMLERAVDLVETKRMGRHMYTKLEEAKETIERLKHISKMMHKVLALDQRTIAEIRGYSYPSPEIHAVMKATLLLLGHYEEETREWKNVQAIIGKTGRQSLKRKINTFDINHCKLDIALGAKKLLGDMQLEHIVNQSCGAATFFEWVNFIADEVAHRRRDEKIHAIPMVTLAAVRFKAQCKNHDKIRQAAQADLEAAAYAKPEPLPEEPPGYQSSFATNMPYFQEINEEQVQDPDLPSPFAKSLKNLKKKNDSKVELAELGASGGEDYVTISETEPVGLGNGKLTVGAVIEQQKPQKNNTDSTPGKGAKKQATKQATNTAPKGLPQAKKSPPSGPPSYDNVIQDVGIDRPDPVFANALANLPDSQGPPDASGGGMQLPGGDDLYTKLWLSQS